MMMRRRDKKKTIKEQNLQKSQERKERRETRGGFRAGDNQNETEFVLCLWLYWDEKYNIGKKIFCL